LRAEHRQLHVVLDPKNTVPVSDPSAKQASANVTVKATKQFVLPYVRVPACTLVVAGFPCYGPSLLNPALHIAQSNAFIQAVYPLADGNVFSTSGATPVLLGNPVPFLGLVYLLAKAVEPTAKRAVGIVPQGYFAYHLQPNFVGGSAVTVGAILGVLVQEGNWLAAAHEVGHTFGFADEYDPGDPTVGVLDAPVRWIRGDHWLSLLAAFDVAVPDPATARGWLTPSADSEGRAHS